MLIQIDFGATAPRLADQLKQLNCKVDSGTYLPHYQQDADAITRLHVRGLLSESAVHAARKKLLKNLSQHLVGPEVKPNDQRPA